MEDKVHQTGKTRCSAITRRGGRCQGTPRPSSNFCFAHDPSLASEREAARVKGGKNSSRVVEARRRLIDALTDFAIIAAPKERFQVVEADPADNRVLEAAVAGSAGYAVWGDRHLLDLHIRVIMGDKR